MTIPEVQQHSVEELIDLNLLKHKRSADQILDRFRNTLIVRALSICHGNISEAAVLLQMHRTSLVRWMDEFGLREDGSQ